MKYRILLAVLLTIALVIVVGSGFSARTDVILNDYGSTQDGSSLTMEIGVAAPMGYVRACSEKQVGERLYIKFYSAFGGYNGSIGAKKSFLIETPDMCREIYFYRDGESEDAYDLILSREDASSAWERPE